MIGYRYHAREVVIQVSYLLLGGAEKHGAGAPLDGAHAKICVFGDPRLPLGGYRVRSARTVFDLGNDSEAVVPELLIETPSP